MATYVILSRISPQAVPEPKDFKSLAESVEAKIKAECPGVFWRESYATLGRFDVVDIVDADDPEAGGARGDDHPFPRALHDGDTRRHAVEQVPGWPVASAESSRIALTQRLMRKEPSCS